MRRRRVTAAFDEADAHLEEVLAQLEGADNYKQWLLELLAPHLRGRILEVGAGRGTYSRELRSAGTWLTAIEPSVTGAEHVARRVSGMTDVEVVSATLGEVARGDFDCAVMLNVLEHIDDDAAVLRQIYDRLSPGGELCIWVPAFQALSGEFDRRIGHYRRYRRDELCQKVRTLGFEIADSRYANLPGFFAWFVVVRLAGSTPTAGGLSKLFDRLFVPIIRVVERRVRPPFGQSVLVVARKPDR